MPVPKNRQEFPDPHRDWRGADEVDPAPNRALSKIARLWATARTTLETPVATLCRYALRLVDRTTGIPYSADELEEKILSQVGEGSLKASLAGGNVFTGAQVIFGSLIVEHSANPALDMRRTTTGTSSLAGAGAITAISSGDAADGFGPLLQFRISDTGVSNNLIGAIAFVRAGADNTGDFVIRPQRAGSASERLRVTADGAIVGAEAAATPTAPAANGYTIYAEDNGSGKTRLMVRFPTGAAQQIAIEP